MTRHALAVRLAAARQTHQFIPFDPADACKDEAEAYAVQAEVAAALATGVAGWKVGLSPAGGGWAAPIFTCDLIATGGEFRFRGDMKCVKVEAELGVRFARDLPTRAGAPYSRAEILAAIGSVFAGIELVGVRFVKGAELPFATRLADNFANAAYAAGSDYTDFHGLDLANIRCVLKQDSKTVSDRVGGHQQGDPMTPVIAWVNGQRDQFGGIRAGQFITTGTLTTPYDLDATALLEASLEGVSAVSLRTVAT